MPFFKRATNVINKRVVYAYRYVYYEILFNDTMVCWNSPLELFDIVMPAPWQLSPRMQVLTRPSAIRAAWCIAQVHGTNVRQTVLCRGAQNQLKA